jgi:hypothetical protein
LDMASRRTVNGPSGRVADAGGYNDETWTSGERLGGSFISTMAGGVVVGETWAVTRPSFRQRSPCLVGRLSAATFLRDPCLRCFNLRLTDS